MTDVVVRTTQLTKRYRSVLAVDRLDLEIHRGQIFGLIGPNGAGKTTTLNMILGIIYPTSGDVELFGATAARALHQARQRIGAIIADGSFLPYLTADENLRVFTQTLGFANTARVSEVIELVGLTPHRQKKFRAYSTGMRRRLELAAAILRDPELLILDEPFNGLDPQGMYEVRTLLLQLAAEGKTIVFSSHWLKDVEQLCNTVAVIHQGRLVKYGPLRELLLAKNQIRLRIADPEPCIALLKQHPWAQDIERADGWIVIYTAHERSSEIAEILAQQQRYPIELRWADISLEDFFLSVTKEAP
ncbi:MAG TPA: ABC transporter ATP-binding protein [Anaerolineae bacterium]|nr:ABC transporter ATP-binding protein [Anaerolineae bacterium]